MFGWSLGSVGWFGWFVCFVGLFCFGVLVGWLGLVGWLSALGSMRRGVERLHALAFPRFTTSDISIHVHEFTRADYHFIAFHGVTHIEVLQMAVTFDRYTVCK